jgi:hypothetical protein
MVLQVVAIMIKLAVFAGMWKLLTSEGPPKERWLWRLGLLLVLALSLAYNPHHEHQSFVAEPTGEIGPYTAP